MEDLAPSFCVSNVSLKIKKCHEVGSSDEDICTRIRVPAFSSQLQLPVTVFPLGGVAPPGTELLLSARSPELHYQAPALASISTSAVTGRHGGVNWGRRAYILTLAVFLSSRQTDVLNNLGVGP